MRRRQYLAGVALVAAGLGGCSNGNGNGPRYEEGNEDDLVPPVEDFPSGWEELPDDTHEDFHVFANQDGSELVLLNAKVYEDNETATEAFERARGNFDDTSDVDVGDEAFWGERDTHAITIFRHENAVGQSVGMRESDSERVPDADLSQTFAQRMYEHWQDY